MPITFKSLSALDLGAFLLYTLLCTPGVVPSGLVSSTARWLGHSSFTEEHQMRFIDGGDIDGVGDDEIEIDPDDMPV